ncbi:MAG: SpoIID/LytB domain-containing protein [Peptococcaceae bacterium]|nr:SpoIID/LytB domain-containing protein [Peptococcaceae bacterium]
MKFLRGFLVVTLGLVLILSYLPQPVAAGTVAPSIVRIGLFFVNNSHSGATALNISSPAGIQLGQRTGSDFTLLESIPANQTVKVDINNGSLRVTNAQGVATQIPGSTFVARPTDPSQWINVAEKATGYRGLLEITMVGTQLKLINEVNVEDYLYGVVPKEMSDSWPLEALKAQAVAARTYVAANLGTYGAYGFDLTDDQYSQAYGGVKAEGPNSRLAVDETKGEILLYNGAPIAAVYSSNSGGYTENSENVWNTAIPYLRGVPDPYSLGQGSSMDSWQVNFSQNQLQDWINNVLLQNGQNQIGSLLNISILNRGVSGRVDDVEINGTLGSTEVKNDLVRYYLGNLSSNLFNMITNVGLFGLGQSGQTQTISASNPYVVRGDGSVTPLAGTPVLQGANGIVTATSAATTSYTFDGKGWGHGVGMSQWGAYGMAKAGFDYKGILAHYYQGAQLNQ